MAGVEPWIAELVAHAHRETPAVTPAVATSASSETPLGFCDDGVGSLGCVALRR